MFRRLRKRTNKLGTCAKKAQKEAASKTLILSTKLIDKPRLIQKKDKPANIRNESGAQSSWLFVGRSSSVRWKFFP